MTDIEKLKKRVLAIPEVPLGSDSFILGTKAQQYDVKTSEFSGRKTLSFPVQTARISETAIAASGRPNIDEFRQSRIPQWFIGKKKAPIYINQMDKYVQSGKDWKIIGVEPSGILVPKWTFQVDVLERSGKYLKDVFAGGYPELKSPQMEAIALFREVLEEMPNIKELDYQSLGLTSSNATVGLSQLQTMGIIKVLESGLMVPSIAMEVHGKNIEEALDDSIGNPTSRHLFEIIRKMPGIRFSKLLKHLGIPLENESSRMKVLEGLSTLRKNNIIMMFLNDFGDDAHIVPMWICYSLFSGTKPTVIDAHTLRQCFIVCSGFWDKVTDISKVDKQVDILRGILAELMRKHGVSAKELDEFEPIYRIFISSLRLVGVLKREVNGDIVVENGSWNVLNTTLYIVNSIYRADTPSSSAVGIDSGFLNDLNTSAEEALKVIEKYLSLEDVKWFNGLKE